jgi:hypothetical protein
MASNTISEGDLVRLENGETGTVVSVSSTENRSYPFVYEVQTDNVTHVTNNVQTINKARNLATLISITHNN